MTNKPEMTKQEIEEMDYENKLLGALELLPDATDDQLNRITEILFEGDIP